MMAKLRSNLSPTKILNLLILAVIVLSVLFYWDAARALPSLAFVFVAATIGLVVWQASIVRARLVKESDQPRKYWYLKLESGDAWRLFFIVVLCPWSIDEGFIIGSIVYLTLTLPLLVGVLLIAWTEFRRNIASVLVFSLLLFAFFVGSSARKSYVTHFGVEVLGHFLERPAYETYYRVTVSRGVGGRERQGTAKIRVGGSSETVDGDDSYPYGGSGSRTYTYRDIWFESIEFDRGGTIRLREQDEPLSLSRGFLLMPLNFDEVAFVEDTSGNEWFVTLIPEPVARQD